jgi:gluconate 2-dehydrogenase gamma chain
MPSRPPGGFSRRVFLQRLTFFGGGVVLYACHKDKDQAQAPARHEVLTSSHLSFTNPEFAVLTAACDRVLPRDQDPGAVDANVPQYIDKMLQDPDLSQMRQDFVEGLNALDQRGQRLHQKGFAELTTEEKDALLTLFKDSPDGTGEAHFYELLVTLTLEGFLGDPSYGGNKDKVGWALVGFDTNLHPMGDMQGSGMDHSGMKHPGMGH